MADRRSPRGLQLPTVLFLLVGVAVVSSLAIPHWFSRPSVTLDAAARLLVRDLEEVQQRAAFYFRGIWVEFEADGTGYRVVSEGGAPEAAIIGEGPFERDYDRDAVFHGVVLDARDFAGGRLRVSGMGVFEHEGVVRLSFRGVERSVRIDVAEQRAWVETH